jgi:glucuronate isomerase
MQQEICLAAKHLPNLHLSAAWWYCQFPEIMERTYRLRLDMLPASKWCALFTDAYVAEWTVPKSLLHRRELTRALAAKVQAGYLKEDAVPEIARVVLYDTPRRIYGLV